MDRIIKLAITLIFTYLFLYVYKKSFDGEKSKALIYFSRSVIVLVFLISSISLAIYSMFIKEVGPTKRIIGGILSILLFLYLIHTIKKYLMANRIVKKLN